MNSIGHILILFFTTSVGGDPIQSRIQQFGYPLEIHSTYTPDGFKLHLHRIPKKSSSNKGTFLLVHGLMGSGFEWIFLEENKALAFMLAKEGYDVWLFNARGTTYSRFHQKYDSHKKEYWNYSWHEIGAIDLPTTIDYIRSVIGDQKITYVGHSQGGTTCLVLLAMLPEYNEKLNQAFLLAPAAYLEDIHVFLKMTMPFITLPSSSGIYAVPSIPLINQFIQTFCSDSVPVVKICKILYNVAMGDSQKSIAKGNFLPELISKIANRASFKQFEHYAQNAVAKEFRQFDYGYSKNLELYGSIEPPIYNLSAITAPIIIFYGDEDTMTEPKGMRRLIEKLPNVRKTYLLPYNHLDFAFAYDVDVMVNTKIIECERNFTETQ